MEEIDLKELFLFFWKKLYIIIVVSILFVLVGVSYTLTFKTLLYRGETTLILVKDNSDGVNSIITQNDIVLNQKLVSTYSQIIKSKRVLNEVIDELNLTITFEELSSRISVSSVDETEIIKISVLNEDPKLSTKIANTIAVVFEDAIVDIYDMKNVSVIDKAEVQDKASNVLGVKGIAIYFILGFISSVGVLFIYYYFDTSIKSSEEIEKRLGIAVIGNIPLTDRKGK